jgi:hypothetical protein
VEIYAEIEDLPPPRDFEVTKISGTRFEYCKKLKIFPVLNHPE